MTSAAGVVRGTRHAHVRSMLIDVRIPVVFGVQAGAADALLPAVRAGSHTAGCACCLARSSGAAAFDQLFLDRVHARVPWFTRVVVPDDEAGTMRAALADPVVSTRFRAG